MDNKKEKRKSSGGFLRFIGFCACCAALVSFLRMLFEVLNEKDSQKNYNSEIRRYSACFNALKETVPAVEVHCIKITSFFSAALLDLRKADFGSDLTVDLTGFASAVKILLPKNCSIVNVADCSSSAVEFDPEQKEGLPVITLVGKVRCCAVSFTKDI